MTDIKGYVLKIVVLCVLLAGLSGCGEAVAQSNVSQGMSSIQSLDYQNALICFDAAQVAEENERLIARGRGIAYMGMTDYESAVEQLKLCLSYSDGMLAEMDYDVNYYLAAAYTKLSKQAKAEQIYNAILDLKSDETDAYFLRGNARLMQGRYEEAVKDFDQVVKLEPADFDRLIQIYEILADDGYRDLARGYLSAALEGSADKMDSYDKGRIYYYLEDYIQAQVQLEDAKSSGEAKCYLYLGMAYEATGDYNYAITNVYTTFVNSYGANAEIYNQLGLCYLQQENYQAALTAFQNGMQIEGNELMQILSFNEVVAYEYLGNFTQADALLTTYLQIYPDDHTAARELDFLSTR